MRRIRVLLVEDSPTIRKRLSEILSGDPEIELVGEAGDGKCAIELCRDQKPDVITMDMMLPVMTGLAATEYIMAYCPTPILIVSASTNRSELFKTYDALAAGAVDVLEKPTGFEPDGEWERRFLSIVKLVSRIPVITHPRARLKSLARPWPVAAGKTMTASAASHRYRLVAIGASTGGPGAIVEILRSLPPGFQLPILFVLHLNEPFGTAFADWLDTQTARRVAYPQDGDPVATAVGSVVMAPGDRHLIIRDGRLRLTMTPERHFCRPSVDVLFESVARECGASAIGCLLTGMGRDGAAGLLDIRKAGGLTIAQDEATSVIYGMPREAALLGAPARTLPLQDIGPTLLSLSIANDTTGTGAEA
jgi:two-component system, chemotaxis family, protein-glutamate methylesterase/glutaminase